MAQNIVNVLMHADVQLPILEIACSKEQQAQTRLEQSLLIELWKLWKPFFGYTTVRCQVSEPVSMILKFTDSPVSAGLGGEPENKANKVLGCVKNFSHTLYTGMSIAFL